VIFWPDRPWAPIIPGALQSNRHLTGAYAKCEIPGSIPGNQENFGCAHKVSPPLGACL